MRNPESKTVLDKLDSLTWGEGRPTWGEQLPIMGRAVTHLAITQQKNLVEEMEDFQSGLMNGEYNKSA